MRWQKEKVEPSEWHQSQHRQYERLKLLGEQMLQQLGNTTPAKRPGHLVFMLLTLEWSRGEFYWLWIVFLSEFLVMQYYVLFPRWDIWHSSGGTARNVSLIANFIGNRQHLLSATFREIRAPPSATDFGLAWRLFSACSAQRRASMPVLPLYDRSSEEGGRALSQIQCCHLPV